MIMTIYDFVDFMIDTCQKIEVFGCNEEETIYTGLAEDVPNNIGAMEILSIDTLYTPTTTITLNVND